MYVDWVWRDGWNIDHKMITHTAKVVIATSERCDQGRGAEPGGEESLGGQEGKLDVCTHLYI